MGQISWVSSYPGLELSRLNCIEYSTPKPRGMKIWFELAGIRVVWGTSDQDDTVPR